MNERGEEIYERGCKSVYLEMLRTATRGLGYEGRTLQAALTELAETRAALRELCAEHGDSDWDDDLYLPDVIAKHLARYLADTDDE